MLTTRRGIFTVIACVLLIGCGYRGPLSYVQAAAGNAGLSDRCIQTMEHAYPGADIDVTQAEVSSVASGGIGVFMVRVQGTNKDVVNGPLLRRDIAVERHFENGILIEFHWTRSPVDAG